MTDDLNFDAWLQQEEARSAFSRAADALIMGSDRGKIPDKITAIEQVLFSGEISPGLM